MLVIRGGHAKNQARREMIRGARDHHPGPVVSLPPACGPARSSCVLKTGSFDSSQAVAVARYLESLPRRQEEKLRTGCAKPSAWRYLLRVDRQ